jgi:SAM-dependent methyltransferase
MRQLDTLTDEKIRSLKWYYSTELRPGVLTLGRNYQNVLATRRLMERVDFEGLRVLDIGAMEGYSTLLAMRAGATVTAYDRPTDHASRVQLVKEARGVDFEYVYGIPFNQHVWAHHKAGRELYDCIIFSGVLYHVIEPMLFLWLVRTMLRPGGILIMETSSMLEDECLLVTNDRGRFTPGDTYYHPSTGWIEYSLGAIGFRIMDVEHVPIRTVHGRKVTRSAMTCVLTEPSRLREPGDDWTGRRLIVEELAEYQKVVEVDPLEDALDRIRPDQYAPSLYLQGTAEPTLKLTETIRVKPPVPQGEVKFLLNDSLEAASAFTDR